MSKELKRLIQSDVKRYYSEGGALYVVAPQPQP